MLGISAAAARARQPGNGRPARGAERSSKSSRMIDRSPNPPEALMREIAKDLRPVRPSPQLLHLVLRMALGLSRFAAVPSATVCFVRTICAATGSAIA